MASYVGINSADVLNQSNNIGEVVLSSSDFPFLESEIDHKVLMYSFPNDVDITTLKTYVSMVLDQIGQIADVQDGLDIILDTSRVEHIGDGLNIVSIVQEARKYQNEKPIGNIVIILAKNHLGAAIRMFGEVGTQVVTKLTSKKSTIGFAHNFEEARILINNYHSSNLQNKRSIYEDF